MKSRLRCVAYVASSVDGRIAEGNRAKIDWTSKEDWKFFQNALKKFDAVVVGHNTYRMAQQNLKRRNTIVFTSKARWPKTSGSVTFFNPEKGDFKKFIKERGHRSIAVLGGPKVYDFFLKKGLLDEIFVTIEPYVFSSGVPMFEGKFKKRRLALESIRKLNKKGTILLHYKINAD